MAKDKHGDQHFSVVQQLAEAVALPLEQRKHWEQDQSLCLHQHRQGIENCTAAHLITARRPKGNPAGLKPGWSRPVPHQAEI